MGINGISSGYYPAGYANNKTTAHTGDISFNDTLKNCIETQNTSVENRIENLFENMDVTVKVGECNVSKQTWENGHFPFWNYFNKSSEANVLNDWKNNKIGTDTDLQKYLQSIGFGEMVVIIPENVKNKMLEDEEFAENIIQKLDTWKKNYDLKDNAAAAMDGLNTSMYQMSKSYCITIDEEGEIGNYAVVSGGLDDSSSAVNNNFLTNDNSKSYLSQILKIQGINTLYDKLNSIYPGIKYHVLDTTQIKQNIWQRQEYPFEKFFEEEIDESVLDWEPTSQEHSMLSANVRQG